jgi:dinuclear metal center YbgI/SA1388 family protein
MAASTKGSKKQAELAAVVAAMESALRVSEVPDYPGALNGLQLASRSGKVTRVAAAVDACEPVIGSALEAGADLLLVHHGLFWSGAQRIEGAVFRKLAAAIEGGMAIYSCHIPLDVHPVLGNNAQLAAALGLRSATPFLPWKGIRLGLQAAVDIDREALVARVGRAVGGGRVHVCPGGPSRVRRLGIVTGGAGAEIASAAAEGIDTFLTGEGPHWSYTLAEELGVNILYAGHYATETFGVRALGRWLEKKFRLPPTVFIDHPSGL